VFACLFFARFAAVFGMRFRAVSAEALTLLAKYRWPGNVRQLENTVFRAVVLSEGDSIGIDEFPQIAAQLMNGAAAAPDAQPRAAVELPQFVEIGPSTVPGLSSGAAPGALTLLDGEGEVRALEEVEADTIRFAIAHYRGQMSEVARRLRIGRSTLYRKLEFLGLDDKGDAANHNESAEAR
jgi:DNA-binding NtrC family response regulator